MAASEIGCHSATIAHQVLKELADLPYNSWQQPGEGVLNPVHPYVGAASTPVHLSRLAGIDPLAPASWNGELTSTDVDCLANKGAKLDAADDADLETKRQLPDTVEVLIKAEKGIQTKFEN